MKPFIHDDFLLQTKSARLLYHDFAEHLPIIDYHNHLNSADIANDRKFENITQIWLYGDHYKWRAMRTFGIDENDITGNASDYRKFEKWAETVPCTIKNPLYHWTHLELKRYFGIDQLLSPETAKNIFDKTSSILNSQNFSARQIIQNSNVEALCTTDDPIDSLKHHIKIKMENFAVKVLPSWRPDKLFAIDNVKNFNDYIFCLEKVSNVSIGNYNDLLTAIKKRMDFFHQNGCRISDHGITTLWCESYTESNVEQIFSHVRKGVAQDIQDANQFRTALLHDMAVMYCELGWTQQFHLGALRNNNIRLFNLLGTDIGCDSINDRLLAEDMSAFFSRLDNKNKLARTIIYNLNARDNDMFATMIGNFQDGKIQGKIQWGAPWWFHDQKIGIEKHIETLSSLGLLSCFVGMLTDSRSLLSFTRHEYFRRILCNILGNDIDKGEIPNDIPLIGNMVKNICYYNAKKYFRFD